MQWPRKDWPEAKCVRTVEGPILINPISFAALIVDWSMTFGMGYGIGVEGAHELTLPALRTLRLFPRNRRICTRDVHPYGHISFASSFVGYSDFYDLTYDEVKDWTPDNHRIAPHALFSLDELKEYLLIVGHQILWPDHGIEGDDEARVNPYIEPECTITWNKGNRPHRDSNSAFQDNGGISTRLDEYIACRRITTLVVWGIAGDVCAGLTALHGKQRGFDVYFVTDLSPCVSAEGRDSMYEQLIAAGVHLITSDQLRAAA